MTLSLPGTPPSDESALVAELQQLIDRARQRTAAAVNAEISMLYWRVGDRIHREILGSTRANYGDEVVVSLARQLTASYGRGWGARHLRLCVRFAQSFPDVTIVHTLCTKLSWSHLRLIAAVDDAVKREFYIELSQLEGWSVRQLQERMQSMLFERSAISRQPEATIRQELQRLRQDAAPAPALLLKDPYLLDFLGLNDRYLERDLEDAILREIEQFLLEMGAGFTFVARQKRVQIDSDDFYIDLLFYNRKLRRLVAVELKIGEFRAEYKGQMELYLRWLAKHEQEAGENPPLGIILCTGKKREQIELLELDKSGIHVAEYLTVLPPRETLQAKLHASIAAARERLLSGGDEPQGS
ncbi:PDDEXK nuclease domain-containing protein [Cupriavidus respiraculi]|uniref:PDDEXK nuclease domain-containing protein n=1 Tax=Cupriavidus respiraculi TaxID=195930 RepID=UPI001C975A7C|nr:PDDEXK nuclease domain-containing protein [Cupriavidus respiraculi]MBY4949526.1 PDDEXK nuclease domain-containing protein [Cupriavidus respiraculi]